MLKFTLCHYAVLGFILIAGGCQSIQPEQATTDHPLIDKIWSVDTQQFIEPWLLKQNLLSANILLLGETHDNVPHHQLQSEMIAYLLSQDRSPAVAFEMLNRNQQDIIDQFQQSSDLADIDAFAKAVAWETTGWPDWSYYRPVFKTSLEAGLPVIGANLNHQLIREVIKQGPEVLESHYQNLLQEFQYDEKTRLELETEIFTAHCEMLPKKHLPAMLTAQQLRDISMSQILLNQQTADGIVLVAGTGHIRNDFGVPSYLFPQSADKPSLKQEISQQKVISLAFIEINEDALDIKDYAAQWNREQLPFDYVWFTAAAVREDQCELLKQHMKKKPAHNEIDNTQK